MSRGPRSPARRRGFQQRPRAQRRFPVPFRTGSRTAWTARRVLGWNAAGAAASRRRRAQPPSAGAASITAARPCASTTRDARCGTRTASRRIGRAGARRARRARRADRRCARPAARPRAARPAAGAHAAARRAREQTAVHGHRLRAVFAQVHRAQPAVAAQRIVGAAVRRRCARGSRVASHATTSSSRHIAPWCGIKRAPLAPWPASSGGLATRHQDRQAEVESRRRARR